MKNNHEKLAKEYNQLMKEDYKRGVIQVNKAPNVLVSTSGGKDSQACLKMACETYGSENVCGVFSDTGWEHPDTYRHINTMQELYNVEIITIKPGHFKGSTVEKQIISQGNFPGPRAKFCTTRLKQRPLYNWTLKYAMDNQPGHENSLFRYRIIVGIRLQESRSREKKYNGFSDQWEGLVPSEVFDHMTPKYDKYFDLDLPVLLYSNNEIFDYVGRDNVNPLYGKGMKRVGCFPCLANDSERSLARAYNLDSFGKKQKDKVIALEQKIGIKHWGSNTGQRCLFCNE